MVNVPMLKGPDGENRMPPKLPTASMTTYALLAPKATHTRPISCVEALCQKREHGWKMGYDLTNPAAVAAANLIKQTGKTFTHEIIGTNVIFTFAAGQDCFEGHTVPLEREPFYVKRNGDWRGNPRGEVLNHVNAEDWVDDFANHQDQLATRLEQG